MVFRRASESFCWGQQKGNEMSNIKLFESKHIRSIWDDKAQRWLFAIVDVVAALTESQNPQVYWRVLKKRLLAEGNETVTNRNALKMLNRIFRIETWNTGR